VVSETTAASTYAANFAKESSVYKNDTSEELEEDLFAYSRDSKHAAKEDFVGEDAFHNYYKKYRKFSKDPKRFDDSPMIAFMKE